MATLHFIPAKSVYHPDGRGRELRFSQSEDGTVEVKVSASLKTINTVYQDSIFVQTKSELEQPEIRRLEDMTREERKALLQGIAKTFEVVVEEGAVSQVKKSAAVKAPFFHKVRSVTLTEK